jgi:hypothetical protein
VSDPVKMRAIMLSGILASTALGCTPAPPRWVTTALPEPAAAFTGCYALQLAPLTGSPPLGGTWEVALEGRSRVYSDRRPDSSRVSQPPWLATIQRGVGMAIDTGQWRPLGSDSVLVYVILGPERQTYSLRLTRDASRLSGLVHAGAFTPDGSSPDARTARAMGMRTPCG